jgi:hypothetical protein
VTLGDVDFYTVLCSGIGLQNSEEAGKRNTHGVTSLGLKIADGGMLGPSGNASQSISETLPTGTLLTRPIEII